ncbi:unnamed protein product, partial [Candidula unifasciata]
MAQQDHEILNIYIHNIQYFIHLYSVFHKHTNVSYTYIFHKHTMYHSIFIFQHTN